MSWYSNMKFLNTTLIPRTSTPRLKLKDAGILHRQYLCSCRWSGRLLELLKDMFIVFLWGGIHSKTSIWEEIISCCSLRIYTFWYINDFLSINNNQFHTCMYVDSIYPNELEIKDTTECSSYASYLNTCISLKLDTNGKLTTQLYHKRDDFSFSIVNCPLYLCSNIPISPA
jgi:hypothetical protein